jgi:hypothetical protein
MMPGVTITTRSFERVGGRRVDVGADHGHHVVAGVLRALKDRTEHALGLRRRELGRDQDVDVVLDQLVERGGVRGLVRSLCEAASEYRATPVAIEHLEAADEVQGRAILVELVVAAERGQRLGVGGHEPGGPGALGRRPHDSDVAGGDGRGADEPLRLHLHVRTRDDQRAQREGLRHSASSSNR